MNNNTTDFRDLVDFVNESSNDNKFKRRRRKRAVLFAMNLVAISSLILGGYGIKSILDQKRDYEEALEKQKIKKIPVTEIVLHDDKREEIVSNYSLEEYVNKNSDTVGWLKVPGTDIDISVVQAKDNDYYLTHDFDKKWNSMGWVFADYRDKFPELSQNTILYGHTYRDTIMFSSLKNVLKDEWMDNPDNFVITFNTVNHEYKWQIFSIYTIDVTSDYLRVNFNNSELVDFTDMLKERSVKDFGVLIFPKDKILTLSTCYGSSARRLVVHAKLIEK